MAEATTGGGGPAWAHELTCQVMRRPRLLRAVAAVVRRWPIASELVPVVARRDAVVAAFRRSSTFTSTSHAPNLVAGEFAIGLQDGPRYERERATIDAMLRSAVHLGRASAVFSRRRVEALQQAGTAARFDLVDDYLGPVAWRAMQRCLGTAGDEVVRGGTGAANVEDVEKQHLLALRHVGSHLLVGGVATAAVQCRAEAAAAMLNARVRARTQLLREALSPRLNGQSDEAMQRNVTGLMWVAHPATVQAGAHLMLELLARPAVHAELRDAVQCAGASAWLDKSLRCKLGRYVLELLRFRPPFPVLRRDVPRDACFYAGDERPAHAKAGRSLTLMVIGALFDPRAVTEPGRFKPDRVWRDADDPYMVFGFGQRSCPAKNHVLEMLVSMLIGLLMLTRPCRLANHAGPLIYDGPAVSHMQMEF